MSQIFANQRVPDNFFPRSLSAEVMSQLPLDVRRDVADAYFSSDSPSSTQLMGQFKNDESWSELHNAFVMAQARKSKGWGCDY